ncbi:hypothetical protein B7P43_G15305 [Cryptotermes secundus]|uniref:Uncharacterized protein n=1 Tax=Cryptotermes secundus TaxID=105785 RepID=A0A2J7PTQ6_9NEOP|nr:hypothetical protein B7P43_G15305 [Cryptotermes secundus]
MELANSYVLKIGPSNGDTSSLIEGKQSGNIRVAYEAGATRVFECWSVLAYLQKCCVFFKFILTNAMILPRNRQEELTILCIQNSIILN